MNLFGLTALQLEKQLDLLSEPRFRAKQIYEWLYKKRVDDFNAMTNLNLDLRAKLKKLHSIELPEIIDRSVSDDGAIKVLLRLSDGARVESVYIPEEDRLTGCLSSQVGCLVGCSFCATGYIGFKRNLTGGEIIAQKALLEKICGETLTNAVMMGMGEPLMNQKELFWALEIMNDSQGMALPPRKTTVSTFGWIPGINKMINRKLKVKLAVSLNGTTDEQRRKLIPMSSRYSISELLNAAGKYAQVSGNRITLGYLMLPGENVSEQDARRLVKLASRIPSKINLMQYNKIDFLQNDQNANELKRFIDVLENSNITVTRRISRGRSIDAACGQLAAKYLK